MRKWHAGVEPPFMRFKPATAWNLPDKGSEGYRRYLALGVLGRNLQRLGSIFLEKERKRRRESDAH